VKTLYREIEDGTQPNQNRITNLRRLIRSQVYCVSATILGTYLLATQYYSWPVSLLSYWGISNDLIFQMAVGHWLFSIVEDEMCGQAVIAQFTFLPGENRDNYYCAYMTGLIMHHCLTIFAYLWSLNTHYLAGLCVFGLMFEAPVILVNIRDLFAVYKVELNYIVILLNRSYIIVLKST
jgi:hypothetical protein